MAAQPSGQDPGQRPAGGLPARPLDIDPDELAAAAVARRELGADSERAVIRAFLDSTGAAIDARVSAELNRRRVTRESAAESARRREAAFRLAVSSIALGIPVTAVAHIFRDGAGVAVAIIAWLAIVAINVVYSVGFNARDPR